MKSAPAFNPSLNQRHLQGNIHHAHIDVHISHCGDRSGGIEAQIEKSIAAFSFLPKLHQVLAEAPATYEAYNTTFDLFLKKTSLTPLEQQVVMMTASYENRCHYCTAGHSMLVTMFNMPAEHVEALREGKALSDPKLQALREFARLLIERHGHVGDERLRAFLSAGYSKRQALEVLTGLAAKLLSTSPTRWRIPSWTTRPSTGCGSAS